MLTTTQIQAAIDFLNQGSVGELSGYVAYTNTRAYFEIIYPELTDEARKINNGKNIFDKRTKGWKIIKDTYQKLFHA